MIGMFGDGMSDSMFSDGTFSDGTLCIKYVSLIQKDSKRQDKKYQSFIYFVYTVGSETNYSQV